MSIPEIGLFCSGYAVAVFVMHFCLSINKGKTFKHLSLIVGFIVSFPILTYPITTFGITAIDSKDIWLCPIGWFSAVILHPIYKFILEYLKNKFGIKFEILSSKKDDK